ncbi:hypothetical protein D3C87_1616050 [compost metagenome]
MCKDSLVPFPRGMRLFVQFVQTTTIPQPSLHYEFGTMVIDGNGIGTIRLNLYCIRACLLGCIQNLKCTSDVAIMVTRHLGNDVG